MFIPSNRKKKDFQLIKMSLQSTNIIPSGKLKLDKTV